MSWTEISDAFGSDETRRHDVVVIAGGPAASDALLWLRPGVLRAMRLPSRAQRS